MTTYSTDPALYIFTSLTAGSSHIVTATSRLETILRANRVPFKAVDIATDAKARMLWGRRAGKDDAGRLRKLPGLVQEAMVLGVRCLLLCPHRNPLCGHPANPPLLISRTWSRSRTGTSTESSSSTSKSTTTNTPSPPSTTSLPSLQSPRRKRQPSQRPRPPRRPRPRQRPPPHPRSQPPASRSPPSRSPSRRRPSGPSPTRLPKRPRSFASGPFAKRSTARKRSPMRRLLNPTPTPPELMRSWPPRPGLPPLTPPPRSQAGYSLLPAAPGRSRPQTPPTLRPRAGYNLPPAASGRSRL